jgi:hypothetical protein
MPEAVTTAFADRMSFCAAQHSDLKARPWAWESLNANRVISRYDSKQFNRLIEELDTLLKQERETTESTI